MTYASRERIQNLLHTVELVHKNFDFFEKEMKFLVRVER